MPYLYRRSRGLVDLFIDKIYRKKVIIQDGPAEGGDYLLVINDVVFVVPDPNPGSDESAAIATAFESAINSSSLPLTASTSGAELILLPDQPGRDFSLDTSTTDPEGNLYVQDAPPEAYQVKSAANWDGAFADIQTVPSIGLATPSVGADATSQILSPYVRWRFSLNDYTLDDNDVAFFTFAPIIDGVEGSQSPIYILLTPLQLVDNHTALILQGDAPAAADVDSALQLRLPSQSTSVVLKNTGVTTVFLSFGSGNAEIPLEAGETFRDNRFGVQYIRVRGDGAAVPIYIYVTLNTQRFL